MELTGGRDYAAELDELSERLEQLRELFLHMDVKAKALSEDPPPSLSLHSDPPRDSSQLGNSITYSGQYQGQTTQYQWQPLVYQLEQLHILDTDKTARILNALGHKQRLDIIRALLIMPMTGSELVEQLNMGTTGQLYHHTKALLTSDLLMQEDRGGKYRIPEQHVLPLMLLLTGVTELLDTSGHMLMSEVRDHEQHYSSESQGNHDPHHLLFAIVENVILEHYAGYCTEAHLFLHADGSITVSDNGRGIPLGKLHPSNTSHIQHVLTNMSEQSEHNVYHAPGSEKGISISIVNALSSWLTVEVKREGKVYRQSYQHGIPQTEVLTVGVTQETGTSISCQPNRELFRPAGFQKDIIQAYISSAAAAYPGLKIILHV